MSKNNSSIAVESATTHRQRILQAFLFGNMENRRKVDNGWKSFITSIILAALICVGCIGYSFISHALQGQSLTGIITNTQTQSPAPTIPNK